MITLSSTQSLQIVLAGAKNTNDASFTLSYTDSPVATSGIGVPVNGSNNTVTNGVTAVTMAAAPGTGFTRLIRGLALYNADLAAITATFEIVDTVGPATTIIQKITRQTLENLTYNDGTGFQSFDVNGAIIAQAATTSANASTALAAGSQASSMASLGISQLAGQTNASINSVSSQAASMAALVPASVSSAASLALLVSTQQSGASVQSFTSTTWSTASSLVSRVKTSFTW